MKCLLCGADKVVAQAEINFADLKRLYKRSLNIDIDECISGGYKEVSIPFYKCNNCFLEFFPPELAGNDLLYEKLGKNEWYYGEEKWEFEKALGVFKDVKSVLEIGCGEGHFLKRLKVKSPQTKIIGLELNKDAIKKGRANGLNILNRTIEAFSEEDGNAESVDAVCSFQVLEHVTAPRRFIESSIKCLKKSGLLFIFVPNNDGFTRFAANCILNMPPHHITRWNRQTMGYLAKKYNLELIEYKEEPVAEYHMEWYRITLLKKFFLNLFGMKFGLIEPTSTIKYKLITFLAFVSDKLAPDSFWKYNKYTGHTFCAVFKKL